MGGRKAGLDMVVYGDVSAATVAPDLSRLRRMQAVARPEPGFTTGSWLAVASVRGRVVGFARAERTPDPFPADHPRRAVVRELGVDRSNEWLAGGLELVELVVDPAVRGRGIGCSLQETIRTPAVRRRAWVALAGRDAAAVPFYCRRGWTRLTARGTGSAILLPPDHPVVRGGTLPDRPAPTGAGLPWTHWAPA